MWVKMTLVRIFLNCLVKNNLSEAFLQKMHISANIKHFEILNRLKSSSESNKKKNFFLCKVLPESRKPLVSVSVKIFNRFWNQNCRIVRFFCLYFSQMYLIWLATLWQQDNITRWYFKLYTLNETLEIWSQKSSL